MNMVSSSFTDFIDYFVSNFYVSPFGQNWVTFDNFVYIVHGGIYFLNKE